MKLKPEDTIEGRTTTHMKSDTYLELSADGRWMRVIVGGKLTVTFNVKYVEKIIGGEKPEEKQNETA